MAMYIKTNNTVEAVYPQDNEKFSLGELQALINGHIRMIDLGDENYMIIDIEHKSKGLPTNYIATAMYCYNTKALDVIGGNVIVCIKLEVD